MICWTDQIVVLCSQRFRLFFFHWPSLECAGKRYWYILMCHGPVVTCLERMLSSARDGKLWCHAAATNRVFWLEIFPNYASRLLSLFDRYNEEAWKQDKRVHHAIADASAVDAYAYAYQCQFFFPTQSLSLNCMPTSHHRYWLCLEPLP